MNEAEYLEYARLVDEAISLRLSTFLNRLVLEIDKEMMDLLKEDIPPAFLKAFEEEG